MSAWDSLATTQASGATPAPKEPVSAVEVFKELRKKRNGSSYNGQMVNDYMKKRESKWRK